MPIIVKVAIGILSLSWGWALLSLVELEPMWPEHKDLAALQAGYMIFQATMIFFASRRRGWARVLLALNVVLGLAVLVLFPGDVGSLLEWFSGVSPFILDVIAVCLLFSPSATNWYRANGAVTRAL